MLATLCAFFIIKTQTSQIDQQKASLQKLQSQEKLQEAQVVLFEQLYKNSIDWHTIESQNPTVLKLQDPLWKAHAFFSPIKPEEKIEQQQMLVEARIQLSHKDELLPQPEATLHFYCVKHAPS